jgi:hypothetical protein
MLHGIGSFLDILLYDPLFKPLETNEEAHGLRKRTYFRSNDKLYRVSQGLITSVGMQPPVGVYQWARSLLKNVFCERRTCLCNSISV